MKIFRAVAVFALFITGRRGSEHPFNQKAESSSGPYMGESKEDTMGSLYSSTFFLLMEDGLPCDHAYNPQHFSTAEGMPNQHVQTHEYTEEEYTEEPDIDASSCNAADDAQRPVIDENMETDGGGSTEVQCIDLSAPSSACSECRPSEEQESASRKYKQFSQEQGKKQSKVGESTSNETDSSAGPPVRKKRKTDETNGLVNAAVHQLIEKCKNKKSENLLKAASGSIQMQGEPGSTAKAKKSLVVNSQVIDNGMLQAIQKKIELEIELWIFRRLFSSRRRGYKVHYNKIYTYKIPNESITREIKQKFYQNELKRDIHFFSTEVAPVVEENLLWYFIASRTTTINLKYRDLLGLKALLSDKEANEHREMVEKFKGYYPGVIDEMIAYVDKHKPMRTFQNGCLHLWSEKLGDIYTREHLKPKHYNPKEDAWADQVERKYHPLACAVRMILVLPEVYMDFCKIDAEFIKNTLISENTAKDKKLCEVLLKIQDLVYMHAREKMDGSLYRGLYSALESMFGKERMEKLTTVELYKGMHAVIANFYKKSDSFDKRNKHILQGKFIIKNQTHVKCEAVLDTSQKDAGKHALASKYSLEENRWGISPDVHAHYHIYYVDNTTHQPRMLCMPMHVDADGHKYYLHTIRDIIEYIKELYEIAGSSDSVHPFKVHKKNKKWSYVKKKEERNKRVEELGEYEVVFYRIEEDPKKTKFTFAEFVPFYSHAEGNIAMPLFLTPLMRSAVDLGPFIKEKEHTLIDSLEFEDRAPDVYTYDSRYKNIEYSDVYSYYSNLYMLPHEEKRKGMECYAMSCATEKIDKKSIRAVWYVRAKKSVDEYTHCILDKAFSEKENARAFDELIETLESREHYQNSELEGFRLSKSQRADGRARECTQDIFNLLPHSSCYNHSAGEEEAEYIRSSIIATAEKLKEIEERQKRMGSFNKETDSKEETLEKKAVVVLKSITKKKLGQLYDQQYISRSRKPDARTEFIVFRNVNQSKSDLGAHNEILDIFTSLYKRKKK